MHISILSCLIILGVVLLSMEALSTQTSGWLIKKYTFTKLYWFGFIGYSLISTVIVLSVGRFNKIKKRSFTIKAVILSHVILVGLAWIFIGLGLHDLIQDAWKKKNKELEHIPKQVQYEKIEKQRPPIAATPLSKHLKYKTSNKPIEPDKQKSE